MNIILVMWEKALDHLKMLIIIKFGLEIDQWSDHVNEKQNALFVKRCGKAYNFFNCFYGILCFSLR